MRRIAPVLCLFVLLLPVPAAAGSDPYADLQWGLDVVHARRAWQVADGKGITVAVIDSGVDPDHPDLEGQLVPGRDLVDDDAEPWDENGHGTLIAGIIAANAGNGEGIAGVAPAARIMPVRVLDEHGTGSSKDVADGISWAVAHGADIVNLSLAQDAGRGVLGNLLADPAVDEAITDAARGGATVVIAAGNDPGGGRSRTAYDATITGALVVGATTNRDKRAAYANHGDGLDLVAPGGGSASDPSDRACSESNGIVSTWWNPDTDRSSYGAGCGTSMAVAFVSGVAAMLHQQGLTNAEVVDRLLATADDVGSAGPDAETGAGRLDAARAVGAPKVLQSPTPSAPAVRARSSSRAPVRPSVGGVIQRRRSTPARIPAPKTSATRVVKPPRPEPFVLGRITATDQPRDRTSLILVAAGFLCSLAATHARRAARRFR